MVTHKADYRSIWNEYFPLQSVGHSIRIHSYFNINQGNYFISYCNFQNFTNRTIHAVTNNEVYVLISDCNFLNISLALIPNGNIFLDTKGSAVIRFSCGNRCRLIGKQNLFIAFADLNYYSPNGIGYVEDTTVCNMGDYNVSNCAIRAIGYARCLNTNFSKNECYYNPSILLEDLKTNGNISFCNVENCKAVGIIISYKLSNGTTSYSNFVNNTENQFCLFFMEYSYTYEVLIDKCVFLNNSCKSLFSTNTGKITTNECFIDDISKENIVLNTTNSLRLSFSFVDPNYCYWFQSKEQTDYIDYSELHELVMLSPFIFILL